MPQAQPHAWDLLLHLFPTSVVDAMARGDILQVVVFATFFGVAVASLGARGKPVFDVMESIAQAMFKVTGYVMWFAPVGVFAAIGATVGGKGIAVLLTLGKLVVLMYVGLALFVLIVVGWRVVPDSRAVPHVRTRDSRTVPDRVLHRQLRGGAAGRPRGDGTLRRAEEHRRVRAARRATASTSTGRHSICRWRASSSRRWPACR